MSYVDVKMKALDIRQVPWVLVLIDLATTSSSPNSASDFLCSLEPHVLLSPLNEGSGY